MRVTQQTARLALLSGAALALQGCVAAAIPIAAGGLIGEQQISRGNSSAEAATSVSPVVEVAANTPSKPQANADLAPKTTTSPVTTRRTPQLAQSAQEQGRFGRAPELAGPNLPPAEPITATTPPPTVAIVRSGVSARPASAPMSPVTRLPEPAQSDLTPSPAAAPAAIPPVMSGTATTPPASAPAAQLGAGTTMLPDAVPSAREPLEEPAVAAIPPSEPPAPVSGQPLGQSAFATAGINQLLSYANSRQISSEETPVSAMLLDRIALTPERAECSGIAPTILIDLDPKGGLFDSKTASRPPSGLARGLNQLRLNGISIAWISGNSIDKLDAISRALRYSGLDLNNEDRVLLVRSGEDRKQTLREELSQISCLIAIAGDTRSDFDELYDYLKNPADAQSLEPLIGDGWFLIPQPLISAGSEQ
ncbi:hypothetical protein INR77_00510 [Erythrobacter sp. SCSIO 43205]|uniref:hypothetical protein n=1 Tax=Erythrobacter sp. SCSIO 43205 TaxID=2779361 RepID=UPI001CA91FFA|nr:hypothetical protein [Erythrobacter sp. SCSIO 43205]UAB78273.1 hypothetical protein INR77_00510 [Erythrobacter sp. SCSIO 43205]